MPSPTWAQNIDTALGVEAIDSRLESIHDVFSADLFVSSADTTEKYPIIQSEKGVMGTPITSSSVHTTNYPVTLPPPTFTLPTIGSPLSADVPPEMSPRDEYRVQPPTMEEESFRHSAWQPQRRLILASLIRTRQTPTRIDRFACCGSHAQVQYNKTTKAMRVVGNYCHDRFCRPCARARAGEAVRTIRSRLSGDRVRFITLSLKHSATPLRDQLVRLRQCFGELRHSAVWKSCVSGGVVAMEVKLTDEDEWHPHLHIVAEGTWIDQAQLSALWYGITGDSYVVDIRSPRTDQAIADVASYLIKYITKPAGLNISKQPDKLDEYVQAIKGVHVIDFLGDWRAWKSEDDAAAKGAADAWVFVGSVNSLWCRARNGDPIARGILFGIESEVYSRYRDNLMGNPPPKILRSSAPAHSVYVSA